MSENVPKSLKHKITSQNISNTSQKQPNVVTIIKQSRQKFQKYKILQVYKLKSRKEEKLNFSWDIYIGHFDGTFWSDNLMGNFDGKILWDISWDIIIGHFDGTFWQTFWWHIFMGFLNGTFWIGHLMRLFWYDMFIKHSDGTFWWGILMRNFDRHFYWTFDETFWLLFMTVEDCWCPLMTVDDLWCPLMTVDELWQDNDGKGILSWQFQLSLCM